MKECVISVNVLGSFLLIASMTSGLSRKYWQPGLVCIILHKALTRVAGLFLEVVLAVGLSTTLVLVMIAISYHFSLLIKYGKNTEKI
jgi:hypothetical protein